MIADTDILYASLLGSDIIKKLPRLASVQNQLAKQVLPPIKFLPFQNTEIVKEVTGSVSDEINRADLPLSSAQQFFPFWFTGEDGSRFLLPYEPIININGKNTIIRRNVAKADGLIGSIKERWNQADYEITITGVLVGSILSGSAKDCFPRADFSKLQQYLTSKKQLEVYCEPLQLLGINHIVIEDFSFPFTKGENVQAYEIKAYSDSTYNLLIEKEA